MGTTAILEGGLTPAAARALTDGPIVRARTKLGQLASAYTEIPYVFELEDLDSKSAFIVGRGGRLPAASVDTGNDKVTTNEAHNLVTGDKVHYNVDSGGTQITGLTNDGVYYARVIDATSFYLYDTQGHANTGGATGLMDLTGQGAGTHVFTGWEGNSTTAMATSIFKPTRAGKYVFIISSLTHGTAAGNRANFFVWKHNGSTAVEQYNWYRETITLAYNSIFNIGIVELDGDDDYLFFTVRADAAAIIFGGQGGISTNLDIFFIGE